MHHLFRRSGAVRRTSVLGKMAARVRPHVEHLERRRLLSVAAPAGVTAVGISPSAIALQWNASPDPTVSGYDVFAKLFAPGGGGKGTHPGHYYYVAVATNLTATSGTITGLATGTFHTYVVGAVSPAGLSPYSTPVTAETWVAPSLPYGSAFLLPSGALYSSPLSVTAGLTTQITLLAAGNPLTYSVQSGPATVSIDPASGVVTYTPALSEVGSVAITFKISNTLGSVAQSVQFNVTAPNPNPAKPTLTLSGTALTYNGQSQSVSATAVGADGMTPVAGTFTVAYNGSTALPKNAGTYGVLATFTSADPNYADATVLGKLTIGKATPVFNTLSSPTVASFALPGDANLDGKVDFADLVLVDRNYGMTNATWADGDFNYDGSVGFDDLVMLARNYGHSSAATPLTAISGAIAAGPAAPSGDSVTVVLNGVAQGATVDAFGNFSAAIPASALPLGTYTISYAFAGDANFNPAAGVSTLTVIPTAPPKVTVNPTNVTTSAGDVVTLTAAATGSPPPAVRWQLSTDGGLSFADIFGATSDMLSFASTQNQNGYRYRAVFTNAVGAATTSAAVLTVQSDTGGTD